MEYNTIMNTFIYIAIKNHDVSVTVQVPLTNIVASTQSADAFLTLAKQLMSALEIDPIDHNKYDILPLTNDLQGQWFLSSPVGKHGQTPHARWEFATRIANATLDRADIPAIVFKPFPMASMDLDHATQWIESQRSSLENILGKGITITVDKEPEPEWLTDAFDGYY
jgi:hypothetical protein